MLISRAGLRAGAPRLAAPARQAQVNTVLAKRLNSRNTAYTCLPGGQRFLPPQKWLQRAILKYLWIGTPFASIFLWIKFYTWRFAA